MNLNIDDLHRVLKVGNLGKELQNSEYHLSQLTSAYCLNETKILQGRCRSVFLSAFLFFRALQFVAGKLTGHLQTSAFIDSVFKTPKSRLPVFSTAESRRGSKRVVTLSLQLRFYKLTLVQRVW